MLEHIADAIIDELDASVGEAIRQVGERESEQATVSLTFTVARDKDDKLLVVYQAKDGTKRGGEWRPTLAPRLPFDDAIDEAVRKLDGTQVGGTTARVSGRAASGI